MSNPNPLPLERISALVDGRLPADEWAQAMDAMAEDPQAVQTWHAYQLIGDVMRSDALAPTARELDFCGRLASRLAMEPSRIAIAPAAAQSVLPVVTSANDASVRWKWLAGMSFSALMAIVVAGGWKVAEQGSADMARADSPSAAVVAQQVATGSEPAVMVRDPELDALMAAHQQLGGHSAFQMPSGFLRNATFTRSQR